MKTMIMLAVCFAVLGIQALYHAHRACKLQRMNEGLQCQIDEYKKANAASNAVYFVQQINTDHPEFSQFNGKWCVTRRTTKPGYDFFTVIKVFADEDNDFNLREAEELCEMLNSK